MARKDNEIEFEQTKKEQEAIIWENKMLSIFMPATGLIALIVGLTGFILTANSGNVPIIVVLIILFLLGIGGVAYGVVAFLKKQRNKFKKDVKEPDEK